jgi:hypothetical protein
MNLLTADEMASCAGDYAALEELANTKMPEVEAALAAQVGEDTVATEAADTVA